jgi:hypothetical protein
MEQIVDFILSIIQFLLSILDAFFGTNHSNDNDRESQNGGNMKKMPGISSTYKQFLLCFHFF